MRHLILAFVMAASLLPADVGWAQQNSQFEGLIEPARDVRLAFAEPGLLKQLHVDIGSLVQKGQPLAVIDDDIQQTQLRIAQAQALMHGELKAARAEQDLMQLRAERLRQLYREELARPDELQRAEKDYQVAAARVVTAEEAQELRRLEVEQAQMKLERRIVRAPFSGLVTDILTDVGEFITPNDPVVLRLISADEMVAVINVPSELAPDISVGQPVEVHTSAPPTTFAARIHSISPSIDGGSGTVEVRAAFANPGFVCRDGDRCSVIFTTVAAGAQRRVSQGSERR